MTKIPGVTPLAKLNFFEQMYSSDGMMGTVEQLSSLIRTAEKTCMFIDNSNLFHSLRNIAKVGKKLNYVRLRDALAAGRHIDVRFYFSEPNENVDLMDVEASEKKASRDRFYYFLRDKLDFRMVGLPLRERSGKDAAVMGLIQKLRDLGVKEREILDAACQRAFWLKQVEGNENVAEEKGLDCEIVYDMARLSQAGIYKTFILIAGDEDYARTVDKIRDDTGITVEVAFFGTSCSSYLRSAASRFVDLNEVSGLFREDTSY